MLVTDNLLQLRHLSASMPMAYQQLVQIAVPAGMFSELEREPRLVFTLFTPFVALLLIK